MADTTEHVADNVDAASETTVSRPPTPDTMGVVDMAVGNALIVLSKQRVRLLNIANEAQTKNDPMRIKWAQEAVDAVEACQQV